MQLKSFLVAAQSLLGSSYKLMANRGKLSTYPGGAQILATIHPSALLRMPSYEARREGKEGFIKDLKLVAQKLEPHE